MIPPPSPPVRSRHLLLVPHPNLAHIALLILARRLEIGVLAGRAVLVLEMADDGEADKDDEAGGEDAKLWVVVSGGFEYGVGLARVEMDGQRSRVRLRRPC